MGRAGDNRARWIALQVALCRYRNRFLNLANYTVLIAADPARALETVAPDLLWIHCAISDDITSALEELRRECQRKQLVDATLTSEPLHLGDDRCAKTQAMCIAGHSNRCNFSE